MVHALRHEPFRTLYLAVELAVTVFIRLPTWLILFIPKSGRPRPTWTYQQSIMLQVMRLSTALSSIAARAGRNPKFPDHHAIVQDKGVKGIWIPPSPDLVVGQVKQWADQGNIKSITIPGYWYDKQGHDLPVGTPARPGEKVVYLLHGGAFIAGTASPVGAWGSLTTRLTATHPSIQRGFNVEYRRTTGPPEGLANPFPTALIDVLAGYAYLINDVGFKAEDIITVGDSAGANLALALTRYLLETRADPAFSGLPIPAPPVANILLSPWVDIGNSHDGEHSSERKFLNTDYLTDPNGDVFVYARENYCKLLGWPEGANTSRFISPASKNPNAEPASFKSFPPAFITYGDVEILYDQIQTLEKRIIADQGAENVEIYVAKDACHDILVAPFWEPEYTRCFDAIEKWLGRILPGPPA
ncbi:hypothetical protein EUX98_g2357 [Antrodiella citrinella]|uniref:Alpha/beta hydrolase fold-3 domain-containing protein n=1 Tax=Antrodiella citrinella TaxID=2447956 RepID=A0A4S4N214_9APHY|nr:hypothetical protein EUX98_g2357 [Antrodiella citrinella]